MGRKKKRGEKIIIFCYYCDRIFDEEKVLIQHQRAKHFKCYECGKRLGTAQGMQIHMFQVHKQTAEKVPFSIKGRDSFEVQVYGMSGVPEDVFRNKQHEETGFFPDSKKQKGNEQHKTGANPIVGGIPFPMMPAGVTFPGMPPMMAPGMGPGGLPMPSPFPLPFQPGMIPPPLFPAQNLATAQNSSSSTSSNAPLIGPTISNQKKENIESLNQESNNTKQFENSTNKQTQPNNSKAKKVVKIWTNDLESIDEVRSKNSKYIYQASSTINSNNNNKNFINSSQNSSINLTNSPNSIQPKFQSEPIC